MNPNRALAVFRSRGLRSERFFCTEIRQLSESRQLMKRQLVWIESLGMDLDLQVVLIVEFPVAAKKTA
jgi:hypothetical protein